MQNKLAPHEIYAYLAFSLIMVTEESRNMVQSLHEIVCINQVINMATMENFAIISDKFNLNKLCTEVIYQIICNTIASSRNLTLP